MSLRHRHSWWSRCVAVVCGSGSILCGTWLALSLAQVPTHITPDTSLGTTVTPQGRVHTIVDGTTRGTNLFHSFDRFDVGTGDTARFTGPNAITNILSRVTGGQPSLIDGRLQSGIPGASLFVLNPRGVLFGPNAELDVSGSLHVSTADYLRLADGVIFRADLTAPSVLSVALPAAFGFLAPSSTGISIQESVLEVPEGRSLSLVGGDVRISGGLRARGGRVSVVSVASAGEATFDPATQTPDIIPGSFARLGSIDLSDQAFLSATGNPDGTGSGGTIVIRGGHLMMKGASELRVNTLGDTDGAPIGIDVHIAGDVVVTDDSLIQTIGFGAGRAGDVVVAASTATVQNGGIQTDAGSTGSGGDITLDVGRLTVTGGGAVGTNTAAESSGSGGALTIRASEAVAVLGRGAAEVSRLFAFTDGTGPGGSVAVSTPEMLIDGGTLLARTRSNGSAGDVRVEVDRLRLTGEGNLSGFSSGAGPAGSVTVTARESVSLAQGSIMQSTVDASASGTPGRVLVTTPALQIDDAILGGINLSEAAAGDVEVRANRVSLTAGGQIVAGTSGTGKGGTITIIGIDPQQPADIVSLAGSGRVGRSGISSQTLGSGNAGRVSIATRSLRVDGGGITSNTFGAGQGGDIELHVGSMMLTGSAFLSSSTGEETIGRGGKITVTASEAVSVTANSLVSAFSLGRGDAGRISIAAPSLRVESGARITTAAALGGGRAGNIAVDVGRLWVSGATIDSATFSAGRGGDVTLHAQSLELSSGALISASSSSTGNAGTIQVEVSDLSMRDHSLITTEASRAGGGNIEIEAQLMSLLDSDITATVETGKASGGNIRIGGRMNADGDIIESLDRLSLEGSRITANTDMGDGANITMGVRQVVLDSNSAIAANTNAGVGGNVVIAGSVTMKAQVLSRAGTIVLRKSQITANAQAGQGGRINIAAEVFLADPDSGVDASSQIGIDGEVNIEAAVSNLSEVVEPLSPRLASEMLLLRDRCAARLHQGLVSSFVERERAGIPSSPDGLLPSRLNMSDTELTWSGDPRSHGIALASEPSWQLSSRCP